MTSVLNINDNSSFDINVGATQNLSNAKTPATLIIQPPSSINTSDLLIKRGNSSYLGDLLLKKVRSQTANTSQNSSNQQSPNGKEAKEAADYEPYDNQPEDEVPSPSKVFIPQRSLSTPIFSSAFSNNLNRNSGQSSHKQILNALETLQKNILEYQVCKVRNAIIQVQLSQSLVIPPLRIAGEAVTTPVKKLTKITQDNDEDEPEIYYGEVEYPLLHLAPKAQQLEESVKKVKANKVKAPKGKKISKLSNCSSPSNEDDSLLESLTATRAGTQRSEPEMTINLRELSEQIAGAINKKNKKSTKNSKTEEKGKVKESVQKPKKTQKKGEKEKKQKSKKGANNLLLSPMPKGRKMTERKKNRWQKQEDKSVSPASETIEEEN